MADQQEWSQQAYARTITSQCWWYTPFSAGWGRSAEHGIDLATDEEVRAIVAMETGLGEVPAWAERVARGAINFLPPCGHYLFPQPYLEALTAIGTEQPPAFLHTCYTADRDRKARLLDYVYCLDAWLAGATPEAAAQELTARRPGLALWDRVCPALWHTLGERTDTKELLVARLLHRQRWWAKALIWDDDARDVFVTDHYLGDPRGSGDSYGNPGFLDPYFTELEAPRAKHLHARLAEICPHWDWFRPHLEQSWLCAPKALRFLERLLWAIGQGRPPRDDDPPVPKFLHCEDTYPDAAQAARWWQDFLAALRGYWQSQPTPGGVGEEVARRLGPPSPEKCWLVRLLVRKLELYEQYAEIGRLVRPRGVESGM